jgi:hypothetical protein
VKEKIENIRLYNETICFSVEDKLTPKMEFEIKLLNRNSVGESVIDLSNLIDGEPTQLCLEIKTQNYVDVIGHLYLIIQGKNVGKEGNKIF